MSNTTYRTCPRSGLQFEAQAEKLMKKVDKTFKIGDDHVSQSDGALHVAPVDDPRPAVEVGSVADDFA